MVEAGIGHGLIVHHTGHDGGRARGDSSLLGNTDANWLVTKKDGADHRSTRYFQAWGRDDVDVPESRLEFDRETRVLTVHDGGRGESRMDDILEEAFALLSKIPDGLSKTKIREKLGFDSGSVGRALDIAVETRREVDGWYMERAPRPGQGRGFTYSLTRLNPSEPVSQTDNRMVTEPVFPVSKETGNGQYPVKPQTQENQPVDKQTSNPDEELERDVVAILARPQNLKSRRACTAGPDPLMTQARWNRANKHIKGVDEFQLEFEGLTRDMETASATLESTAGTK